MENEEISQTLKEGKNLTFLQHEEKQELLPLDSPHDSPAYLNILSGLVYLKAQIACGEEMMLDGQQLLHHTIK